MIPKLDETERGVLEILDSITGRESARTAIDPIVLQVEQKLAQDPEALLTWQPVPLGAYGEGLPDIVRSSWVFVLRAGVNTGPESHPNSHQRMMSYRGSGDLRIRTGDSWCSNPLVSDRGAPMEKRWVSIPPNVWHEAVVPKENWVVLSFHTVPEGELVEQRPDSTDGKSTRRRRYLEPGEEDN